MSTALAGKGGTVSLPGTPGGIVGSIGEWTCVITSANYDASALGDEWEQFVQGQRGFNGRIHGFYNIPNNAGHENSFMIPRIR